MRSKTHDAIIVGAGFAGLYMLYRLKKMGLSAIVFEQGTNVGGTWYWNRYPGARCDAESLAYSYSFSKELQAEWEWSERYARQAEILEYAEHVAERFDLRKDIRFETRVSSATFDETANLWSVNTEPGETAAARFCIMATGCLSVPQRPAIDGLDDFAGELHQASLWPHDGVDFCGKRVGVIGTGSSGIQAIPVIAEQADQLTVFQRTANFSVPAVNGKLDPAWVSEFKKNYEGHRQNHKLGLGQGFGDLQIEPTEIGPVALEASDLPDGRLEEVLEDYWNIGGARFMGAVGDALTNEETNRVFAQFVHNKIHQIVNDSETAETLCPNDHPIGTKRICVDTDYYATYNRNNVTLVNVRDNPIERITKDGVQLEDGATHKLDTLVIATGFDAMTGALLKMDIRGVGGETLAEKWSAGPVSYLGLCVAGFPNLFTITGPGSPSVLSNMLVSIEQHVDWLSDCIAYMQKQEHVTVAAKPDAEKHWVAHVNDVANETLFPKGGSWYLGANVAGKPRVFMPYAAGVGAYREICDQVVKEGYRGFQFG